MKRIVVDTNVLVSFLTDRDAEQQDKADGLFRAAASGEHELHLPQVALIDMVYVLRNLYDQTAPEIAASLRDLLALPGVFPVDELSWAKVLGLWPGEIGSLTDAALVTIAKVGQYDAVATFDRPLGKLLRRQGVELCW